MFISCVLFISSVNFLLFVDYVYSVFSNTLLSFYTNLLTVKYNVNAFSVDYLFVLFVVVFLVLCI